MWVADLHAISALRGKRALTAGLIDKLEQHRADLTHIDGVLRLFQPDRDPGEIKPKRTTTHGGPATSRVTSWRGSVWALSATRRVLYLQTRDDRRGLGSSHAPGLSRAPLRTAGDRVPRCRPERLRRSLCDLQSARAAAPRCRSHHHGFRRAVGQPVVSNGLPLTKIHHAAFDAHLIGIRI